MAAVLPYRLKVDVPAGAKVTAASYELPSGVGLSDTLNHTATEDLHVGDLVSLDGNAVEGTGPVTASRVPE